MIPRLQTLFDGIKEAQDEIAEFQNNCKHPLTTSVNKGSTGNWDGNFYWIEYRCQDCNKQWSEDQ